jgi:ParB family chromosome partitioning protein
MNNAIKKTPMTVEHHCLDLAYAPIRLQQRGMLNKLKSSIEQHGQLVPVVVVAKAPQQWVLVDGYFRVKALKHLGKDTIAAEIWDCDIAQALLVLLRKDQSRRFGALEEALLLRELQTQHNLSQHIIAERLGRDQSWVSRRLALIEHMPDFILKPVINGALSLWASQRILAPMARAIPAHAEKLLAYLLKNHTSTREIQSFYAHYQQSHSQRRSKMVNEPGLFFKAQNLIRVEKGAKNLRNGPEGKWQAKLTLIASELKQSIELIPEALYPNQGLEERMRLLGIYHQAKSQFDLLTEKVGRIVGAN